MANVSKKTDILNKEGEMITLTFPDGAEKEFSKGISGLEVAESISKSLAKIVIAAEINETLVDLSEPIHCDGAIKLIKRDQEEALEFIRHDAAHVMAQAVQELYPGTQVTIGPVIENGFYLRLFIFPYYI